MYCFELKQMKDFYVAQNEHSFQRDSPPLRYEPPQNNKNTGKDFPQKICLAQQR